jgi:hypothetical protein
MALCYYLRHPHYKSGRLIALLFIWLESSARARVTSLSAHIARVAAQFLFLSVCPHPTHATKVFTTNNVPEHPEKRGAYDGVPKCGRLVDLVKKKNSEIAPSCSEMG